jgi:CDP-6-deoxy-D-xylo-4-hexulose-3-dehydrase
MRVPLAVVGLNESDIENVVSVLRSGKLTMGDKVAEFEIAMADYLNVDHFIMVNSGSSANLLIFESLLRPLNGAPRLENGDGVLVPAIAWPTSIWPIIQLGLVPIFVDVDRDTFGLDLDSASDAIAKSKIPVKAIFPIHPLGYAIDQDKLSSFAHLNSLILVSDVCESLGSWNRGLHAGMSGIAASFSFYFSHHITTMEGGGIATNDSEMADDFRSMRSHGWSRDRLIPMNNDIELSAPESKFQFARVSNSIKNTPLTLVVDKKITKNLNSENHSWMMIPICVNADVISKEKVQDFLEDNGVETRPVLTGNFLDQPVMKKLSGYVSDVSLDNANWVAKNCFLIGAHHDYTEQQINHLTQVLSMTRSIK